ncbi:MAG: PTS lactose/cellobiose transporter subunit IIA [Clostridium sp.]|uniref:PTS lactose/cellobiose transporter subunit IIA n=1 Tax=Clostridium sp. TaxID=1506 RepID=UPI001EC00742|nr:PTS lactose/cellobiose transporter subunit IIA [Clostridium sp.]MBS5885647.1 PTS lactose/cellobiose transporter subunit IIA [Clostridium sp.]MDU7149577.1 PTS lactose/cellobiose transporter subunit IIA [Clostridium sp.]MDU7242885.1 PTS lactose/cellobiose transporter subunit IIA [Clostridium sp.]
MGSLELICFEIISNVGMARGSFIEAIDLATEGKFHEAEDKILEGDNYFSAGHSAHTKLIQQEAEGNKTEFALLLIHAEDQLMSTESFRILAEKFIALNKKIENK